MGPSRAGRGRGGAVDPKNADHVFLAVAVLQLKLGPDGTTLYAATHGRGIHGIQVRDLS
ncbi:hypothetical protein ABTX77_11255 [Streptomyces sp. NPDC097704]|uniref:hypothetical protein n=1 Tax=Streptomyces sp. NPDC097704 TaxID=3157101 RepID=UPI0033285FCE